MRKYSVNYNPRAKKQLEKLDTPAKIRIKKWIDDNLVGTANPRHTGRALSGPLGSLWRYRVGDYRLIASISDAEITITVVKISHRGGAYDIT